MTQKYRSPVEDTQIEEVSGCISYTSICSFTDITITSINYKKTIDTTYYNIIKKYAQILTYIKERNDVRNNMFDLD